MNNPSTILVVGGAGYIGSHVCKAIAAKGMRPVCFDNLCSGHRELVRWGPLMVGDLADRDILSTVFATHPVDAVMHFAAYAYVGESVRNPARYYANNVANTLNLLDCMRDAGVRDIVFSSTCATYGNPLTIPIDEDHPQAPINPYGWSKLMVEQILKDYSHAYGLHHASLRYFNAAGADPDAETGEWHDPETHLIPLVLDVALGRCADIAVFGDDYPTPDGTCIRDYIHIADLVSAHILALGALESKDKMIYNVGSGNGFSVREVIETARKVTGHAIPTVESPRRPGDSARLVASPTRIMSELGWKPTHTNMQEILSSAWEWHKSHPNGYEK